MPGRVTQARTRSPLCANAPAAADLRLRPEQADDLAWLQDLYASTRSDELAPVPWPEATKRAFLQQQFALQHAHYRQHFAGADFSIVQMGDLRIGRLYLHRPATHHTLVDISLLPQWRGQGIGSQLIGHAQAMARDAGCVLSLHVLHANPAAQRLYARHGFVAGPSNQTHLQMHWHPHDHRLD
ncbi:GNAT family N-acetyltransferase [Xanthomonas melonis]|uniref:GNAT family N-acetyltransferase n=1 Tax=Xanthomonas melonis TaxID=56456 RepID=A0ABS8NWQ3_9XANT|nr:MULTISPECIES: GNAT family N-acetyltransferase [Xanthomonas]MCC4587818.1 GNAT family N-acetyltransferase [Xanthomonas sp. NCPPB 1067]MCD0245419.1 GNAT family N-acetyltransferase [Xanthomonas melonis]MCD0258128.1 GNAT family N-acetyltransferase [Xanthomonas melonis]MCD0266348.1 GNAT family N-acetyltransferase [Xanthomonas melonis]